MSEPITQLLDQGPDRVELALRVDPDRWAWQSLPSRHPVALAMAQYHGSIRAVEVLGFLPEGKRSALTGYTWTDGTEPAGPVTRCTCVFPRVEQGEPGFEMELFDAAGVLVSSMTGKGVIFATRDFEAWRSMVKTQVRATRAEPLRRLSPGRLGLGADWPPFIGELQQRDGERFVRALVPKAEALPPAHRFHAGSGDHVNVPHLYDCALQVLDLLHGPRPVIGGEGRFRRYVELDLPFELRVTEDSAGWLRLACFQAGEFCARLGLQLAPGPEAG